MLILCVVVWENLTYYAVAELSQTGIKSLFFSVHNLLSHHNVPQLSSCKIMFNKQTVSLPKDVQNLAS